MKVEWSDFKSFVDSRKSCVHHVEFDNYYHIISFDANFQVECKLDKSPTDTTDLDDFENNYKASSNKKITSEISGFNQVVMNKPEGSSSTKVTHDWTDKCTWHQNATQVTGETMTNVGLVYSSVNAKWIDLEHGRVYGEDDITDKKIPVIYDNGVAVTTGITIDYDNGTVTFASAPTGPVTCDYYYGSDSTWTLSPTSGKIMIIEHAELQFTKDSVMQGEFLFEIYVWHPDQVTYPGVKVPYQTIRYKNMKDVINAANLGQGYIPAIDVVTKDVLVFPFNYATVKPFNDSYGAELRVSIHNDTPNLGEWGTATFYILSKDE